MPLTQYCTYFDHRYISSGLALYASMRRHCAPFKLWVLCLSDECYRILAELALPSVSLLRLGDLETADAELLAAKKERSSIEYYFTCTPALMAWLLDVNPDMTILTYLDADLYFFGNPNFLLEETEKFSTLIVPHNFSKRNTAQKKFGTYNVGWLSFRRDVDGLACLRWWRRACIEWCRDVVEDGRFADQKYLDQFPERFVGVRIVRHPGVNLAPWNLDHIRISAGPHGEPRANDQPVVFFHFHGLRRLMPWLWWAQHSRYGAPLSRNVRALIYAPYLLELGESVKMIQRRFPISAAPLERGAALGPYRGWWRKLRQIVAAIVRRDSVWVIARRVL